MRLRETSGFTLVELVLTVGVLALAGSMAALSVSAMLDSYRLKEATNSLTSSIREAQIRALREGLPWRVVIDSDGGGYSTQFAPSSAYDPADCGAVAGWTTARSERFRTGVTIDTSTMSRTCVGFGSRGQTGWPNPAVLIDESTAPYYGGPPGLMRIVDGVELDPSNLPNDPRFDEKTITWWNSNPVVVFDFDELRRLNTPCLGLYSRMNSYRFPSTVRVEASASASYASAVWTTVYNGSGPASPGPGQKERVCMSIPVNGAYRYIRVTLTRSGSYVVLDELDGADLTFVVHGAKASRRLVIGSVTGRVTVESN